MDDRQLIEAYVAGAREGGSPNLHIETDALFLAGWWQAAFRVSDDAFIVRGEAPPQPTMVVEQVKEALRARGLKEIPGDHPLIEPLTYTELTLVGGGWRLWGPDERSAVAALAARVGADSVARDWTEEDAVVVQGLSSQLEGARRIAGLPPSLIVAVGLPRDAVYSLEAAIPECRFESKALGQIAPEACGDLGPSLIVVEASGRAGREFIMELRAAACGRFLPVAAVTPEKAPPPGADVALDANLPAPAWREALVALLP